MLIRTLILTLFCLISATSFAQSKKGGRDGGGAKINVPDSVLKKKLSSLYFDDSLNRVRVFSWKINSYTNTPTRVAIDTGQRKIGRAHV